MSTAATAPDALATTYCTFWVDGLFFGVGVAEVQEVLRHQPMTPVPRAAEAVTGLINLRGQIVTAVDLRVRLGLPPRDPDTPPMNVIVRSRGEVVSLLVDDIGDVIDLADSADSADSADLGGSGMVGPAEPAPSNMPSQLQDVVSGVRPLADAILLVLDADRAVDVSTVPDTDGGRA